MARGLSTRTVNVEEMTFGGNFSSGRNMCWRERERGGGGASNKLTKSHVSTVTKTLHSLNIHGKGVHRANQANGGQMF